MARRPPAWIAPKDQTTPAMSFDAVIPESYCSICRDAGLYVILDLHGAPGSQNGLDNSGLMSPNPDELVRREETSTPSVAFVYPQ